MHDGVERHAAAPASAQRSAPARATRGRRVAVALLALVVVGLVLQQVRVAWRLGGEPSGRADPYSEADAMRSGEGFASEGFTAHHGLPDVMFGGRFPQAGTLSEPALAGRSSYIYTHYPPGPNWIAGMMTCMCGVGGVRCFRLAPLAVGTLGLAIFAWALARRLGPWPGLLLLLLTALPRMTTLMMHGLHYQGYAQSLLLVQLGLLCVQLRRPALGRGGAAALGALGFAQGWLSFDHAFLVTFAAVPVWLATSPQGAEGRRPRPRDLRWAVLLPGLGFSLAHALHFLQVVLELGGISPAIADFREVARWRAVGAGAPLGPWGPIVIVREYLTQHVSRGSYFGEWAYLWLAVAALVLTTKRISWWPAKLAGVPIHFGIEWRPAVSLPRRGLALLTALLISSAWIMLMRNHAHHHPHFLPRHFFLLYFTGMLLLVEGLRSRDPAPAPS